MILTHSKLLIKKKKIMRELKSTPMAVLVLFTRLAHKPYNEIRDK